jgi:immunity protein, SdpI family
MYRWCTVLSWVLVVAMFIAAGLAWPAAPDSIPVHWNVAGEGNRYGGKFEGLLLLPISTLAVLVLLTLLPRIDPWRERYAEFSGAFAVLKWLIVAFLAAVYAMMLATIFGVSSEHAWSATHRAGRWVFIGMGAAILLAGLVRTAWAISMAMLLLFAGVFGLVVYSYLVWRDERGHAASPPT